MNLKVRFIRADKEGWGYLKGTENIEVADDILLSELSSEIQNAFGIPDGRSHAFYMRDTLREPFMDQYSDLEGDDYLDSSKFTLKQALLGRKFKYEYSFSDGLLFQCEVLDSPTV